MTAPRHVGVIGAGRMGSGIAQVLLTAGSAVTIVEADATTAASAVDRIAAGLRSAVERGHSLAGTESRIDDLAVAGAAEELGADLDLVIEAVPELPALKADVLSRASRALPRAVIASNTSSISIDELAATVDAPGRFIGMHFFNPVPGSALVEVVRGTATDDSAVQLATETVTAIGKHAVVVRDAPGFASSRLGVLLGLEAIRMVEEGVAEPAAIDEAMTLGYGHRMGPLRSTDLVGLDVRLAIAEYLERELGDRFRPPALLREMVADGRIGRKSGQGFFAWDAVGS
jgi:3-hydroxybutyryl-CoA dehydrogenase